MKITIGDRSPKVQGIQHSYSYTRHDRIINGVRYRFVWFVSLWDAERRGIDVLRVEPSGLVVNEHHFGVEFPKGW